MKKTIQMLLTAAAMTACGNDVTKGASSSQLDAAGGIDFVIPAEDATFQFKGADQRGNPCELVIRTNSSRWITRLLLTGTFSGRGMGAPSTMTPLDGGGYEGVADMFKDRAFTDFGYENHVFRRGLTLYWGVGRIQTHQVEAKLFGESLMRLEEVRYSDHGPFLQLDGVCKNLVLASQHP